MFKPDKHEIYQDFQEWHSTFDSVLMSDTAGHWPCGGCGQKARWERSGRNWSINCTVCEWKAVGTVKQTATLS